MFPLEIRPDLSLHPLALEHAEPLFALVDAERERLREWLPWVDATGSVEDTHAFIIGQLEKRTRAEESTAVLVADGRIAGALGVRFAAPGTTADIGYWLSAGYERRGLVTAAVRAVVDELFGEQAFHRIEIRCAVGNERSCAIPRRLGFTHEGILREAQCVNDRFLDINLFALLRSDPQVAPEPRP